MNYKQLKAIDPSYSIWVQASAGTGKTKVLTDRVLRLLLEGASPSKILCLTFTKAAASEMRNRIDKALAEWGDMSVELLKIKLKELLGNKDTQKYLNKAKSLYHERLTMPSYVQIQTIHSFCQRILKQFPFEAGISPGFMVIDEYKVHDILNKVKIDMYNSPETKEAFSFILLNLHEQTILENFKLIVESQNKFKEVFTKFKNLEEYEAYLKKLFSVNSTEQQLIDDLILTLQSTEYRSIISFYNNLTGNNLNFTSSCTSAEKLELIENLKSIFLTKEGLPRLRLDKNIDKETGSKVQNILLDFIEKVKSINQIKWSCALFSISMYIVKHYEDYKQHNSYLDYDDLIFKTYKLLNNSLTREWVLYKLDGGIDHILIDEAQDTNYLQWNIIEAIISDFYSGYSAADRNRTIFVVGDHKQSIYSFQGVELNTFNERQEFFRRKFKSANKKFDIIDLDLSYRSTELISSMIDKIFSDKVYLNSLGSVSTLKIDSNRQSEGGRIEVWPIIYADKGMDNTYWPIPDKYLTLSHSSSKLANFIADYIKNCLDSKRYLSCRQREVRPEDFMILVRTRNKFSTYLVMRLKQLNIDVAGVDRIALLENIAVKDILSLAKFLDTPEDDLNLACLLKSPFIGISEQELYKLCRNREDKTLWQYILKQSLIDIDPYKILTSFHAIYKEHSFAETLNIIVDAMGYRIKLLETNGIDSKEAIDELLNLALEKEEEFNMSTFIKWLEENEIEVKRDMEHVKAVRIMTVHSAKGLQAPIVILADTISRPQVKETILWSMERYFLCNLQ